jgi:hypothetical protein
VKYCRSLPTLTANQHSKDSDSGTVVFARCDAGFAEALGKALGLGPHENERGGDNPIPSMPLPPVNRSAGYHAVQLSSLAEPPRQAAAEAGTAKKAGWGAPAGPPLPAFRQFNQGLRSIAAALRSGTLQQRDIGTAISRLPRPPEREVNAFWTPGGAAVRHENVAAWVDLARIAPKGLLPPNRVNGYAQSLTETSIVAQFNTALIDGNTADVRQASRLMGRWFPSSPFNASVQAQAQRMLNGG